MIVLLTLSCRQQKVGFNSNRNHIITGKGVDLEGTLSAKDLIVIDSLIIIQEFGNDFNFNIYDKNAFRLIKKFGMNGRGPFEYKLPVMMKQKNSSSEGSYLIVYDLNNKRIDSINIFNILNKQAYYPKSTRIQNHKISEVFPMRTAVIAADSFIVGTAMDNPKGKFFCLNLFSSNLTWEPFYPVTNTKPDRRMLDNLYMCDLALRPDKQGIASTSLFFERIDILDKCGRLKRSVVFENKEKEPDFSNPDIFPPVGAHEYFTSVAVTQDYVYGLNIDRNIDDKVIIDSVSLIRTTWEDKHEPPEVYRLTPAVMKIAVDDNNKIIYGIKQLSSELYIYDLKQDTVITDRIRNLNKNK